MNISIILLLVIKLLTYASISLNIPILRQVFGFIYVTFIPGFVILRLLKPKEKNIVEIFILSAGLSIAFLMFIGLLINELYPLFGVLRPLSIVPLTITIASSTLLIFLVSLRKSDLSNINFLASVKLKELLFCTLLCSLLILGIIGAVFTSAPILLLVVIGIAALYAASIFTDKIITVRMYPLMVFTIALTLLFFTSLISNHVMGWDVFREYYVFKLTETAGHWRAPGITILYSEIANLRSVLSVTILPTIYSVILNIDGELIFKVIFPFIFALIPLSLYRICELQSRKSAALLSTFLFISNSVSFYGLELLSLARQIVAELFFVLLVLCLIHKNMSLWNKRIFFIIFSAALVLSHYSLAFLFLFYSVSIFIYLRLKGEKHTLNEKQILLLAAFIFSWYLYVSNSPLNQLTEVLHNTVNRFWADFFEPQARVSPAIAPLFSPTQASLVGLLHKYLIYIIHFVIFIGAVALIFKPRKFNFTLEFRIVAIVSGFILALCFVVPNFAFSLNITRFYQITMLFLAPLFGEGGFYLYNLIREHISSLKKLINLGYYMLGIMLIAFFLFQVGFVNHITGDYPYSYSLDFHRRENSSDLSIRVATHSVYFLDQEVYSAIWLKEYSNGNVYADRNSRFTVLKSWASLDDGRILQIVNGTALNPGTYLYLKYLNIQLGVISTLGEHGYAYFNTSDIAPILENCAKIYSSGGSEIYRAP